MIIFLWDNIFQVSDDRLQIPIHLEKQLQYSKTRYIFSLLPSLGAAEGNYVEVTLRFTHRKLS